MNYQQYKKFHFLLKIEKELERIVSKDVKEIIFGYIGNDTSTLLLENNECICRFRLNGKSLVLDSYDKAINTWSDSDISFSFSYRSASITLGTGDNLGIGTGNVGIGTTIPIMGGGNGGNGGGGYIGITN